MSVRTYGDRNVPLRRPYDASVKQPSSLPEPTQSFIKEMPTILSLITLIGRLDCNEENESAINMCIASFEAQSPSSDEALTVIRQLHAHLLVDSSIVREMAFFINEYLKTLDASQSSFIRSQWLSLLQENFEKKDESFSKMREVFLNAVEFHGEVYNLLLVQGMPFKILAAPMMEYLTMLLSSGTLADHRLLLLQLLINGKYFKEQCSKEYEIFCVNLRRALYLNHIALILAVDITSDAFPHPLNAVQAFYKEQLDDVYTELECRHLKKLFVRKATSDRELVASTLPELRNLDDAKQKEAVGILPDVHAVRERMRAKGLLPRLNSTEINGKALAEMQGPGGRYLKDTKAARDAQGFLKAMTAPLPTNDDIGWD